LINNINIYILKYKYTNRKNKSIKNFLLKLNLSTNILINVQIDEIFLNSQEVIKFLKSKQNSINLHKEEIELLNLNEKFKEINDILLYLSQKFNEFTDDQKKYAKDFLNINIDNQRKVLNDFIKSNFDMTIKYKSIIFPPKSNFDDNNNSTPSDSSPTTSISSTSVPTTNTVVSSDNTVSNPNVFPITSGPNINDLSITPNPVTPNSNYDFQLIINNNNNLLNNNNNNLLNNNNNNLLNNNNNNLLNNIISNSTTFSSASDITNAINSNIEGFPTKNHCDISYFKQECYKDNINKNETGKELGNNNDIINTDKLIDSYPYIMCTQNTNGNIIEDDPATSINYKEKISSDAINNMSPDNGTIFQNTLNYVPKNLTIPDDQLLHEHGDLLKHLPMLLSNSHDFPNDTSLPPQNFIKSYSPEGSKEFNSTTLNVLDPDDNNNEDFSVTNEIIAFFPDESKNGNLSKTFKEELATEKPFEELVVKEPIMEEEVLEELVSEKASRTKKKKSYGKKKVQYSISPYKK